MGRPGKAAVVLLVEDEAMVRNVLRKVLEIEGHHVLAAKDAEEAIELSHGYSDSIDVLVTDVNMHRMDGFTLLDTLRKDRPALKALVISGKCAAELVAEARGLPFLTKPVFPSVLQSRLREILEPGGPETQIV